MPPIERSTGTIKERARLTCNNVLYRRFMILMIRTLIEAIVYVLNSFPSKKGIFRTISSIMLVEGRTSPDFFQKMISYGAYALVYSRMINTMTTRDTPAIALRKSINAGGHYFMSLRTCRRIHWYKWKELPLDIHH